MHALVLTSTSWSSAGRSLSVDMGLSGLGLVLGLAPLLRLSGSMAPIIGPAGSPPPSAPSSEWLSSSPLAEQGVQAEPGVGCSPCSCSCVPPACCSCSCWRRSLCSLSRSKRRMPKLMLLVDEALLCTEARLGRREPARSQSESN